MTADQILESPEPIETSVSRVRRVCKEHGQSVEEYESEMSERGLDAYDLRNLLNWLGY